MNFTLRNAQPADMRTIRRMVWAERLNPMQLRWQNFLVAVNGDGEIIGCTQVKRHGDGTRELSSVVVLKSYRGLGIARALIEHWLSVEPPPLELTCRESLQVFYRRFGFASLRFDQMSPYFKRISRLVAWLIRLVGRKEGLAVMRWSGPPA